MAISISPTLKVIYEI